MQRTYMTIVILLFTLNSLHLNALAPSSQLSQHIQTTTSSTASTQENNPCTSLLSFSSLNSNDDTITTEDYFPDGASSSDQYSTSRRSSFLSNQSCSTLYSHSINDLYDMHDGNHQYLSFPNAQRPFQAQSKIGNKTIFKRIIVLVIILGILNILTTLSGILVTGLLVTGSLAIGLYIISLIPSLIFVGLLTIGISIYYYKQPMTQNTTKSQYHSYDSDTNSDANSRESWYSPPFHYYNPSFQREMMSLTHNPLYDSEEWLDCPFNSILQTKSTFSFIRVSPAEYNTLKNIQHSA